MDNAGTDDQSTADARVASTMHSGLPPVPAGEHARQARLDALSILDTQAEEWYDDLVALASELCGTPIALLSLVDRDRQWFKARVGLDASETHRDLAFCAHAVADPRHLFTVEDATRDPRFADNALVTGDPRIRFYAGAPIVTDDGHALGTVCVIDTEPRKLTPSQERCLQALAKQAAVLFELRRRSVEAARKAIEQAQMTSEARLKQERGAELLELVLQGRELGLWDLDVRTGGWSASVQELEMLGYVGADGPPHDWRTLVHPDDLDLTVTAMEPHLRGAASFYECTHRMRCADGRWIWVLSRAVVVLRDTAGRPARIVGTHMDVTDARRAETDRQRTADRLELALAGGDIGIWDVHVPSGKIVYNAQWGAMLGYPLDEVERQPDLWKTLAHPDDSAAFVVGMGAHLRGELAMLEVEGRMRHKDGHWVWILTRAKVFERDANGRAVRIVGTNLNISSRKASDAALTEEIARRRVLLDHASESIFVLRHGLRLTEVNRRFADTLGYTVDEVMQLRPWQWDAIDDDREKFAARWSSWDESTWTAEMTWRRKDGSTLDVALSCTTIVYDSGPEYLCVCRDITDSKRDRLALESARALLEQTAALARVGGWAVDLVGRTVSWSREVYRIHEVESDWIPDLPSGIEFYAPEARPVITAAVEGAIADGTIWDLELPLDTARGRRIWVRTQGHAEYEGARAVRLVGVFQDITERKHAEHALIESERRLRMITDNMPALIMRIDHEERYSFVNAHFGRVFDIEAKDVLGHTMQRVCGDEIYADIAPHIACALRGETVAFEATGMARGELLHYQSHYVPDIDETGRVTGFYALIFDVTARKRAEMRSLDSESLLRGITDNVPACISAVDREGRFRFANATYGKWLGVDSSTMIGMTVEAAIGPRFWEERGDLIRRALAGEAVTFEQTTMLQTGERTLHSTYLPHFDAQREVAGFYALTSDITELKQTQRKLDALARADALTGLPNRRHFEERAVEALARARRTGQLGALFYLDIDRFKSVNDSLGHAGGDELLQHFSDRLTHALRETDFVARYAGDEFVAIAEGVSDAVEARALGEKIAAAVREPFSLVNVCLHATTSIGIATFTGDESLRAVLARADEALYAAKETGRDSIRLCSRAPVVPELLAVP